MKKTSLIVVIFLLMFVNAIAQIKIEDILQKATDLLGKKELLSVKKGFNPVFS